MLSGPETARLLHQFEGQYLTDTDSDTSDRTNHEMGLSSQKTFKKQVNNLADVVRGMGNPFLDDFSELVTLDNSDCMDDAVAETIFNLETLGKTQYTIFVKTVIQDRTTAINSPFKKNKLPLFGKQPTRPLTYCETITRSSRSYTSPCRAVMPTLRSSLVVKYSRTLPHCLKLANSAFQLPSLTF